MNDYDLLEENKNFTISDDINGPLVATVVGLEILAALVTNWFVLIFTLCHPKILKQSSILLLTNFVLANLLMASVYMPTIVITAATGEWVFGRSVKEKVASCMFIGFIFAYTIFLTTFTLTAISVDRFLFIVKPFVHKQYMKTWVVVTIDLIVWIVSGLLTVTPFFDFGEYSFSASISTCIPPWNSDRIAYVVLTFLLGIMCIVTITVTSIWTFCFTHKFIKKTESFLSTSQDEKHVYNSHVVKLMGIFGTMLLVTAVTYAPALIACFVGFIITFEKLPRQVYATITILFYTVTISNPIIQSYFRRDLKDFIVFYTKKVYYCVVRDSSTDEVPKQSPTMTTGSCAI